VACSALPAAAAALLGWGSWEREEGWPPRSLYFHADKDQSFSLHGFTALPGWGGGLAWELSHPSRPG